MKVDVEVADKCHPHRHECRPKQVSIAASRFIRGREIELDVIDGSVVWRRVGDEEWKTLVSQDYLRGLIIVDLTSPDHYEKGLQIIKALDNGLPVSIALKINGAYPLRWIVDVAMLGDMSGEGYFLFSSSFMYNQTTSSGARLRQIRYFVNRKTGAVTVAEPYEPMGNIAQTNWVKSLLLQKVDTVPGKGLSTEDFTTALREKLEKLTNYDDTRIIQDIQSLQKQLGTLLKGDVNGVIDSFNEIEAFLTGITDVQTLTGLLADLKREVTDDFSQTLEATVGNINSLLETI